MTGVFKSLSTGAITGELVAALNRDNGSRLVPTGLGIPRGSGSIEGEADPRMVTVTDHVEGAACACSFGLLWLLPQLLRSIFRVHHLRCGARRVVSDIRVEGNRRVEP